MCMHVPYCTAYVKDSGDLGVCCHEMPLVLPLDSGWERATLWLEGSEGAALFGHTKHSGEALGTPLKFL